MNLETRISPALWGAIRSSYEARNFTGAIVDAIYVITDVLREKADSEADGAALVGHALAGASPKVKITSLRSESEWNEQRGIENILRGIYIGIRNPRSHGKRGDTEEDADSIILFLNYLLRKLGDAQVLFSKSVFIERVLDKHFLQTERYADLLVSEVPSKYLLEVFHDVYARREEAEGGAIREFLQALLRRLSEDEQPEVWNTISDELRTATDFAAIRSVLQMLKPEQWDNLTEVSRLRIENRLIEELRNGSYSTKKKRCNSGALATWAGEFLPHFLLKNEAGWALLTGLQSDDRERQDFVFKFFFSHLSDLIGKQNKWLRLALVRGLKSGDKRFKSAVESPFDEESDPEWGSEVIEAYASFEERFESPFNDDDDDLPF